MLQPLILAAAFFQEFLEDQDRAFPLEIGDVFQALVAALVRHGKDDEAVVVGK